MITCSLQIEDDADDICKLLLAERLDTGRASCEIKKKRGLRLEIRAKDPTSMKSILNTVLKIIETYEKTKALVR